MQEVQEETKRNQDEKDRMWQITLDTRAKEALEETKEAIQKENNAKQEVLDGQHQIHVLEQEAASLR